MSHTHTPRRWTHLELFMLPCEAIQLIFPPYLLSLTHTHTQKHTQTHTPWSNYKHFSVVHHPSPNIPIHLFSISSSPVLSPPSSRFCVIYTFLPFGIHQLAYFFLSTIPLPHSVPASLHFYSPDGHYLREWRLIFCNPFPSMSVYLPRLFLLSLHRCFHKGEHCFLFPVLFLRSYTSS